MFLDHLAQVIEFVKTQWVKAPLELIEEICNYNWYPKDDIYWYHDGDDAEYEHKRKYDGDVSKFDPVMIKTDVKNPVTEDIITESDFLRTLRNCKICLGIKKIYVFQDCIVRIVKFNKRITVNYMNLVRHIFSWEDKTIEVILYEEFAGKVLSVVVVTEQGIRYHSCEDIELDEYGKIRSLTFANAPMTAKGVLDALNGELHRYWWPV